MSFSSLATRTVPVLVLSGFLLTLVGCSSAPKVVATKEASYTERLQSIVILAPEPHQSESDKFGWSKYADGQLGKLADHLVTGLDAKGSKTFKLMILADDLDVDAKINWALVSHDADHLMKLYSGGTSGYSTGNLTSYDYYVVVYSLSARKDIWKTKISAQWQSNPAEMAQNIVNKLAEDSLLPSQ